MRRPLAPLRTTAAVTLSLALALTACGADDSDADAAKDDTSSASSSGSDGDEADSDEKSGGGDADSDGDGAGDGDDGGADSKDGKRAPDSDASAGDELTPEEFANLLATSMQRGRTASLTSDISGATMSGVVDYTRDQPAMRMELEAPGDGVSTDMVMVDGFAYMKMGGTDQYVKMDTSDLGEQAGRMDPGADLSSFSRGITSLEYVGQEKLGGEDTHHYIAVLDTAALGAGSPAGDAGKQKVDYHVWLGTDDLVRRFSLDMGEGGEMTMTFSDWGKPVDIKAPPKNQVTEMPSLPSAPAS